ncbi:M20/M25/M40 family metallo-hydrolase [Amycolatopsis magusensis]|uniref:LysW-gamma-L-lysine carboxypeptidase n=1 Tax=Amycolatopsis magusensis TaxID=882444 RepID=A0ABS4PU42_9PSEU|nr:M20/M25/M40 family metallo-hydrolase [Amycolatopsis magusensis]MBP2182940.1 LysW-gamma-L-lysine carboxypeptidase [Amycolatopsis magusensis]
MSDTYAVGLLRRMLEIPSPSYDESALAAFLVDAMVGLGFEAHVDETGNVVGEIRRGAGPTVMLLGHMDTVPAALPVRSEGGRLYGCGAVDAKGPLAAMICAAASAAGFRGRVVVAGVVEEETPDSRGAMAIREHHRPPDAVVIGEPSGWSSVVLGYKGKVDLRYRVRRPSSHPTHPGPKAIELVVDAWRILLEVLGAEADHSRFDVPGPRLTSVSGGPTSAEAELSIRIPIGFDIGAMLDELARRLPDGELTLINAVPACRASRNDPVVRALAHGIRAQRGRPRMKVKTATSDMNTLAEVWTDVPMATYGPGDSKLDHTADEHILLTDYVRGTRVLQLAVEELGARHGTEPRAAAQLRLVESSERLGRNGGSA